MNVVSEKVLKHRKWVVVFFLAVTVLFTICFFQVDINYNMTDYLPESANSTIAMDMLSEEFGESIPNCNVMVPDVSIAQAMDIKARLLELDAVDNVTWLDDSVDVKKPVESMDEDTVENYYKDGAALFSVTLRDGEERNGVEQIRDLLGENICLSGNAVEQAASQEMALSETVKAICILGPVIILILMLATTSWIEPFIYLTAIGSAVLINLGTEIFRGEISYVTLAVAPMLQLACSLDYAVFLSESYNEHRKTARNDVQAMKLAMRSSFKSILASALTTAFGFLALTFMEFRIGPDMGIGLVKGVVLSFVASMTFLPALILLLNKLRDRTQHRKFMPDFKRPGKVAVKLRFPVFAVVAVIAVFCFLAQGENQYTYGSGDMAGEEAQVIKDTFGETNTMVVLIPNTDSTRELLLCQDIEEMDHVTDVISYATQVGNKIPPQYLGEDVTDNFYSDDYARIIIYSDLPSEGGESFALVEDVRNAAAEYYGEDAVYSCGQSANLYDMKDVVVSDNRLVSLLTVAAIYLVLLITMKSWLLPIILILVIKCAIWINMAVPFFTDSSLVYLGYLVVSTVQMGATIDYAILLTNHYMENRKYMKCRPALEKTMGEIISSVLVSAAMLAIVGFAMAAVSSNGMVEALGILIGRGALIPLIVVNLCLPALLTIVDKLLPITTWKANFYKEKFGLEMPDGYSGGMEDMEKAAFRTENAGSGQPVTESAWGAGLLERSAETYEDMD